MRPALPRPSCRATHALSLGLVAALLTGCGAPPEGGRQITQAERDAAYPALVPVEGLLVAQGEQITDTTEEALLARAAALRTRAARLRHTPVGAAEHTDITAGPDA